MRLQIIVDDDQGRPLRADHFQPVGGLGDPLK
jgi:hypothetical protein